ncbi:MAG: L,D-transpeptidase [bacterium]|nr:L,D-transpeptidase [bacterium]
MKKVWIILGIVLTLLIAGAVVVAIITRDQEPTLKQGLVISDSVLTALPSEQTAAIKELQRLKKALATLKPNRPYIVIDTQSNKVYYRTDDSLLFEAVCSTGSGGELVDSTSDRRWVFATPHGVHKVNSKLVNPWWRKPDWAFIEENEKIPDDPRDRYDSEMLGEFAMGFGNGYFLHGTIYERLLGINVTHGCVRLGSENLKWVWDRVQIGTPVYIF